MRLFQNRRSVFIFTIFFSCCVLIAFLNNSRSSGDNKTNSNVASEASGTGIALETGSKAAIENQQATLAPDDIPAVADIDATLKACASTYHQRCALQKVGLEKFIQEGSTEQLVLLLEVLGAMRSAPAREDLWGLVQAFATAEAIDALEVFHYSQPGISPQPAFRVLVARHFATMATESHAATALDYYVGSSGHLAKSSEAIIAHLRDDRFLPLMDSRYAKAPQIKKDRLFYFMARTGTPLAFALGTRLLVRYEAQMDDDRLANYLADLSMIQDPSIAPEVRAYFVSQNRVEHLAALAVAPNVLEEDELTDYLERPSIADSFKDDPVAHYLLARR